MLALSPLFFMIGSCTEDITVLPTTEYYSAIAPTSTRGFLSEIRQAQIKYQLYFKDGGTLGILKYGVCWAESGNPTLRDAHVFFNDTINQFPFALTKKIEGFKLETEYTLRNFSITSRDTVYGPHYLFKTIGRSDFTYLTSGWAIKKIQASSFIKSPDWYFVFEDKCYVISFNDSQIEVYDIINDSWEYDVSRIIPSSSVRAIHKFATTVGNKAILLIKNFGNITEEVLEYTIPENTWKKLPRPPFKEPMALFSDSEHAYALDKETKATWRLNIATGNWDRVSDIPSYTSEFSPLLFSDYKTTYGMFGSALYRFNAASAAWDYIMKLDPSITPNGGWLGKDKIILMQTIVTKVDDYSQPIDAKTFEMDLITQSVTKRYDGPPIIPKVENGASELPIYFQYKHNYFILNFNALMQYYD